MIYYTKDIKCPMCLTKFVGREAGGFFIDGQDSDLFVRVQKSPLHIIQVEIHSCPSCRFSGMFSDFNLKYAEVVRKEFMQKVHPQLKIINPRGRTAPIPHEAYEFAFRCALFLKRHMAIQFMLALRAYWCMRLTPSVDLLSYNDLRAYEKTYLQCATLILDKRLKMKVAVIPKYRYLAGELHRRLGNFESSQKYFKMLMDFTGNLLPDYLKKASKSLYEAAGRGDGRHHSMESVLYGGIDA